MEIIILPWMNSHSRSPSLIVSIKGTYGAQAPLNFQIVEVEHPGWAELKRTEHIVQQLPTLGRDDVVETRFRAANSAAPLGQPE